VEAGKNSLADGAAPTPMHVVEVRVNDDDCDTQARQHRSGASGLQAPVQKHAQGAQEHRYRRVCQSACGSPLAMPHRRTEASHMESCHWSPACVTEFEAG
jgi:hypothetical protein